MRYPDGNQEQVPMLMYAREKNTSAGIAWLNQPSGGNKEPNTRLRVSARLPSSGPGQHTQKCVWSFSPPLGGCNQAIPEDWFLSFRVSINIGYLVPTSLFWRCTRIGTNNGKQLEHPIIKKHCILFLSSYSGEIPEEEPRIGTGRNPLWYLGNMVFCL